VHRGRKASIPAIEVTPGSPALAQGEKKVMMGEKRGRSYRPDGTCDVFNGLKKLKSYYS